jgi:spore maturation protein CgeB
MKVLFLESDHRFIFGLPLGFRDMGEEVVVSGALDEQTINRLFREFKPNLVVMMGWTREHTQEKLAMISYAIKKYQVPLIYWATEDPTFTLSFSIPLIKKVCPDYIFTVSSQSLKLYRSLGYGADFLPFGYQPNACQRGKRKGSAHYGMSLIANAYPNVLKYDPKHYRKVSLNILLKPLLEKDITVDIWGERWEEMADFLGQELPHTWLHGGIHYLETRAVYRCSEMVIGLQNYKQDVIAMRTYEILGAGGFLITSHHKTLEEEFEKGKELLVVSSAKEMLENYAYYKEHPEERAQIQRWGELAARKHTYKKRAQRIIETLKKEGIIRE